MAYYRYTRLQQYIGGQPTDVYTKGQRADSTEYTTYEDCMAGSDVTRWVAIPQTTCVDGDLWSMEKEQATFDGGETWADTGNTRPVAVIEPDSDRCTGADSDWRIVTGEYICNGTSKCVKEVEYVNVEGSWVPSGRTRAGSIIEILSADCGVMYQWVNVPGEYICVFKCGRGDKYTKQKQQYSLDGGTSWSDTGETREGDFVEKNSAYCGCDTSVTRWITVEGEYVCVGTSKFTKEKEQSSTDAINWTDTGNTRAGSLIETSSSSCASTRWVTVSGQYSCVGTSKMNLEKEQTSTDGEHWTDTGNTRAGSTLIEANSSDCGYVPPSITRWVADTGFVCVGRDKMNKEKEEISYDSGSTWSDTGATRAGSTLIEADSPDCSHADEYLTFTASNSAGSYLQLINTDATLKDIYYSRDHGPWTAYTSGEKLWFFGTTGDNTIRWKATWALQTANTTGRHAYFYSSDVYGLKASGNVMSLLFGDNFVGQTNLAFYEYAFYKLFSSCRIRNIDDLVLPATSLAESCYENMFEDCTFTSIPSGFLPATSLAEKCYKHMFTDNRNLTTIPGDLLPAQTLMKECYYGMFYSCTSLTTSTALNSLWLNERCYERMFMYCVNLTAAPELPATTLADACYSMMFYGCSNLNYIKCLATSFNEQYDTDFWLQNVASTGTFVKASGATWSTGASGIPTGWTVQNV